jgi:citrate synthase
MDDRITEINRIILDAAKKARRETDNEPEPELTRPADWPMQCTIGPGLEGAFACESKIGYVNGAKGWLIYRGYDIFDLCAGACFEEVCYLLLNGNLPNKSELVKYRKKLFNYSHIPKTLRTLMGFPVEKMNTMGALRLGTNMMRQEFTNLDTGEQEIEPPIPILGSDEDSIAMETVAMGHARATYEFSRESLRESSNEKNRKKKKRDIADASGIEACNHLIAGVSTLVAAISRIHQNRMPLEPLPDLSLAGNLLYMFFGERPDPVKEKIMDICLILHADHGMNASTFATMVVASTLADMYFSVGAGIGALSGPLHGGANEAAVRMFREIGTPQNVESWLDKKIQTGEKIAGFGHRVYKSYDPRARILGPLAEFLITDLKEHGALLKTAQELEKRTIERLGTKKRIFPNVDFYSGIVYSCLNIEAKFFTPLFAASRVSGWTARVLEYMVNNRIFRPRALYTGVFNKVLTPIEDR